MSTQEGNEQLERVRQRFTRTAEAFAGFVLAKRSAEVDLLIRMAVPEANESVLDAACGPGTFALRFAPHAGMVIGLDYTPAMLKRARAAAAEAGAENLIFVQGDAATTPFREGSFHVVTCGYTLHHLTEPAAVMGEFARLVRRGGGRVALADLIAPEPGRAEVHTQIERARDASHVRTLTQPELLRMAKSCGLRVCAAERVELPRMFNHWMSVAGWARGDAAYEETRKQMEATFDNDAAGFHPQRPATPREDFSYTQTILCLVAEKP
jgi:ubiquinone/menaquinone biosynthesis C-methylase UbiE